MGEGVGEGVGEGWRGGGAELTSPHPPVGWNDLALFAIFEIGHICCRSISKKRHLFDFLFIFSFKKFKEDIPSCRRLKNGLYNFFFRL